MNSKRDYASMIWSAVGGAVVWWVVLAFGLGWSSGGTVEKLGKERADKAVATVMTPVCVANFQRDPAAAANLAALKAIANTWERRNYIEKGKWAELQTKGYSMPTYELAESCAVALFAVK